MPIALINLIVFAAVVALLAAVFWPDRGLIGRIRRARRASRRMATEDLLKAILKAEAFGHTITIDGLAGATGTTRDQVAELLQHMEEADLVSLEAGVPQLKPEGRDSALHVVRAHRLWERYLADRTGIAETSWHDEAEKVEHQLTPEQVAALSAELGNPAFDPHGDPIPAEGSGLASPGGIPMTQMEEGQGGRIVHIEDEPPTVYAQLVAEGLTPGMVVRVIEMSPDRVHFWADGAEVMLAPIFAANVTVAVLDLTPEQKPGPGLTLRDAKLGEDVTVTSISRVCRGPMRRRLLDLGIVPGTMVTVERVAPGGDPVAYRIRGATIALRDGQAKLINVDRAEEERRHA